MTAKSAFADSQSAQADLAELGAVGELAAAISRTNTAKSAFAD
jgi:hypothetical protein